MTEKKTISGQVSPDRVSALEAEVAQLKVTLTETRGEVINLEGVVRDLGQLMVQLTEAQRDTVVGLSTLTAHATHGKAYRETPSALFCPYCTPATT